mgnify:CR=1 FL=1
MAAASIAIYSPKDSVPSVLVSSRPQPMISPTDRLSPDERPQRGHRSDKKAPAGLHAEPFFDISFSRIGKEMKFHMSLDQPGHPFGKGRFLAPAQQHGFRHFRSFRIMAVIGIAAFFFTANTGQPFGHIVEQSGIANGQVGRRVGHCRQRMDPGIEEMERLRLRRIGQMTQFRQNRNGRINAVFLLPAGTGGKA